MWTSIPLMPLHFTRRPRMISSMSDATMPPPRRLLITGASGFLGTELCREALAGWQVFGACRRRPVTVPGVSAGRVDLADYREIKEMLARVEPEAIVHAAAIADAAACREQPVLSHGINLEASAALAGLAAERGAAYAFISTDLVFDGAQAPYAETAPVAPLSLYGEQKARAEEAVLARNPGAGVFRLPLMFGQPPATGGGFAQNLIREILSGREVRLFTDEFRTPVSTSAGARAVLSFLGRHSGRLHLGGPERISRYELARRVAAAIGARNARLVAVRQDEAPSPVPRPRDVSLDSSLARSLGFTPPPLAEQCEKLTAESRELTAPFISDIKQS